jgi:hypothetical protein
MKRYRGYDLYELAPGRVAIWWKGQKVDEVVTLTEARTTIDKWLNAP